MPQMLFVVYVSCRPPISRRHSPKKIYAAKSPAAAEPYQIAELRSRRKKRYPTATRPLRDCSKRGSQGSGGDGQPEEPEFALQESRKLWFSRSSFFQFQASSLQKTSLLWSRSDGDQSCHDRGWGNISRRKDKNERIRTWDSRQH